MKLNEVQIDILYKLIGEKRKIDWSGVTLRQDHRTFLTPDDIFAVKEALGEKGLWEGFYLYGREQFLIESLAGYLYEPSASMAYNQWLFGKDSDGDYRFCSLVANCPAVIEYVEGEEMNLNKRFAELCGIEWKKISEWEIPKNPDFVADPRLVLRKMNKLLPKFVWWLLDRDDLTTVSFIEHYILDTTGLLVKAAIEFMEKDVKG